MKETKKAAAAFTDGENPARGRRTGIIPAMEKSVVGAYKAIEQGVVGAYRVVETGVVACYKKVEDAMVDKFFRREGENLEQAKDRLRRKR